MKKNLEQLDRESAKQEAEARKQSKDRGETLLVLWGLDLKKLKHLKSPNERRKLEREVKGEKLRRLRTELASLFKGGALPDELGELFDIVGLQEAEIDYLAQFRSNWELIQADYPQQLQNLICMATWRAITKPIAGRVKREFAKRTPKQIWASQRRRYKHKARYGGTIAYEFGGKAEAETQRLNPYGSDLVQYEPTCLDRIFVDGGLNMLSLEDLFGLNRGRFPKKLPRLEQGYETLYGYQAVTMIMDWLLSERILERKPGRRGGSARKLWLDDPELRGRVLRAIETRSRSLSQPKLIEKAFLTVTQRHLPSSAK